MQAITEQIVVDKDRLVFYDHVEEPGEDECFALQDDGEEWTHLGGLPPGVAAVITATLLAGGFLGAESVVTVRPLRPDNPWHLAGLFDLMQGRDLLGYR